MPHGKEENASFEVALQWVSAEHYLYVVGKFTADADDEMTRAPGGAEQWEKQIGMYLHRAGLLGLDNLNGRQAVGKAVATAVGYLESLIRVYETIPAPGVPSGYNLDKVWSVKERPL